MLLKKIALAVLFLSTNAFAKDLSPKMFSEGILSTKEAEEWAFAFTPDQQTIYIQRGDFKRYTLYQSRLENNIWSIPEVVPFAQSNANDSDAFIAPDGNHLYFSTNRQIGGGIKEDFDIWVVDKSGDTWINPRPLGGNVNSTGNEWLPSISKNGNLYFESDRPGGFGHTDLYVVNLKKDGNAKLLPDIINSSGTEESPFIAPDESYLIFQKSSAELYISYSNNHVWTKPRKLDLPESTLKYSPYVTPDGVTFFYTSNEKGTSDIYSVNTKYLGIDTQLR